MRTLSENQLRSSSTRISFMGANYVARAIGYRQTDNWWECTRATDDYFQPLATFAQRFDELLAQVQSLGYSAFDLWNPQLNWQWATAEHFQIARDLLKQREMKLASLAGSFGNTATEFETACKSAVELGISILGGSTQLLAQDRATTISILKEYGVKLAYENHPAEETAFDTLLKIGDTGDGVIGTAVDTGWYATNGYDVVKALKELGPYIMHVHLKDVLAPGAHVTCHYGQGCVDVASCVTTLKELGYQGFYSIEHEPMDYDPSDDCRMMFSMLESWLA